eukprot:7436380-Alexandrium_andersonii.AAC.1
MANIKKRSHFQKASGCSPSRPTSRDVLVQGSELAGAGEPEVPALHARCATLHAALCAQSCN